MRTSVTTVLAFAAVSLLGASSLGASGADLSLDGRVFDATSGKGIAAVTVTLKAPRSEGGKELVTSTDDDGRFVLKTPRARYLLSASRGSVVLFRKVIVVTADLHVDIPLRRKDG